MLDTPRVEPDRARARTLQPATLTRAAFHSLATEIPPRRLTSAELADQLGIAEEWILSRTGIRERPVAGPRRPAERLRGPGRRAGAGAAPASSRATSTW